MPWTGFHQILRQLSLEEMYGDQPGEFYTEKQSFFFS